MPELSSFTRPRPTPVTVDFGDGDTVALLFDRNKITPAWQQEAGQRDEADDPLSLPKALAGVLIEWDLTVDGAPFPPTAENIAVLPYHVQGRMLRDLLKAAVPGEAEGKASPATTAAASEVSSPTGATFQNGTPTSTLPPASASLSTG